MGITKRHDTGLSYAKVGGEIRSGDRFTFGRNVLPTVQKISSNFLMADDRSGDYRIRYARSYRNCDRALFIIEQSVTIHSFFFFR